MYQWTSCFSQSWRLVAAACLAAVCFSNTASAAAPAPAKGKAAAAPAEPQIKIVIDDKMFTFEARDRRDPFSFVKKVDVPADSGGGTIKGGDGTAPPTIGDIDPLVIEQKKAEAEAQYAAAEKAFMDVGKEGKPQEVIAKCDLGLKIFTDLPALATIRGLQEIRERLVDMRKAGERIKTRQEADKRFREVHLRLTGVVARDRRSSAIVNGRSVFKGDVVSAADNYSVVVDEIQADRVVFVSPEGYKMMLTLSEMIK